MQFTLSLRKLINLEVLITISQQLNYLSMSSQLIFPSQKTLAGHVQLKFLNVQVYEVSRLEN